jgi:hypothetical protein
MTRHPSIALTTTIARSNEIITAEADDEIVMMSLEQGEYFGLGAIGSRIWALLEQPMTVAALCDRLITLYAVDVETCQRDTLDFLQELYAAEIITLVDRPVP